MLLPHVVSLLHPPAHRFHHTVPSVVWSYASEKQQSTMATCTRVFFQMELPLSRGGREHFRCLQASCLQLLTFDFPECGRKESPFIIHIMIYFLCVSSYLMYGAAVLLLVVPALFLWQRLAGHPARCFTSRLLLCTAVGIYEITHPSPMKKALYASPTFHSKKRTLVLCLAV